jgi:hypothetical protein
MNPQKSTQWVDTMGVDAVTIFDNKPYFFLFADIDTKDTEILLKILVIFQRRQLSCYHYETTKGYHVVSPTMLTIREFLHHKKALDFLDYRFDTIRLTKRSSDGSELFFNHFNKHFRRKESKTLHNLLRNLYGYSEIEPNENYVNTSLCYTQYSQLKLRFYNFRFKALKTNTLDAKSGGAVFMEPKPLYKHGL